MSVVSERGLTQSEILTQRRKGAKTQSEDNSSPPLRLRISAPLRSEIRNPKSAPRDWQSKIRNSQFVLTFRLHSGDFDETAIIIAEQDANGNASYKIGGMKGAMVRPGLIVEKASIAVVNADPSKNKFSIKGYCANADGLRPVFPNDLTFRTNDYVERIKASDLPPVVGGRLSYKAERQGVKGGFGGDGPIIGGIRSLKLDLSRGRFKIKGRGGDLSSLASAPIQIRLEIGPFSQEATFTTLRKRSGQGEKLKF